MPLKTRTLYGHMRRMLRIGASYARAYIFYHGWSSYVGKDGGRPMRVGNLKFCADPFLFHWQGANWLFYESLDKQGKGYIGCYKEENGKWLPQGPVLEEPWHLSYPQVFEDGGKVYMIPESCDFGKGNVSLYEALEFPKKWQKVAKLIDRPFADSTIFKHEGHWYMACYTIPPKETAELWHAPALLGPWTRHPMWDKINQSRRLRRCGGSFIVRDGRLYRVAQDCNSVLYGKRLFAVEVAEISPEVYREGAAWLLWDKSMPPYNYCHTYNEMMAEGHKVTVVDVHHDSLKWPQQIVADVIVAISKKVLRCK